ncbi:Rpn family recombination-promoting nuclease/putative transposase [Candidatus Hamiltonella defensa]|uniref:Rpn family recombination-promoting nuclease/putative transposase n=1 Tax=Candidatus Williamhamiltonella defendens TaxID=138072 RepID=UPI001582D836|nr:Rpn family recombination-promoting nuclease/putative transposase [Candidatus Hamiltonella defensa]
MTSQLSYHDHFFKKFLGDIAVARDFLELHLPSSLRKCCNFDTLAIASGSFVEDDLRGQCSDMLYSMKTSSGQDGYILCLIEHQSRPEKLMAFRLLRYSVAAMQRHIEQGNNTLPVVIPILFYQGATSPYPYSTYFLDCFADPELAATVYQRAFPLVDITTIPDSEILTHRRVALLQLVQKHIRTRDMLELAVELATLIEKWQYSKEQCKSLLYYIAKAGNTIDGEGFIRTLAEKAPTYREDFMTIAEQLEAKGYQLGQQDGEQKGYQLGRQDGVNEGKQEATRQLAKQLFANGVDQQIIKISTGLTDDELSRLLV